MSGYDTNTIEPKWQARWQEAETFLAAREKAQAEILRARDVPLSLWANPHRACAELHHG